MGSGTFNSRHPIKFTPLEHKAMSDRPLTGQARRKGHHANLLQIIGVECVTILASKNLYKVNQNLL